MLPYRESDWDLTTSSSEKFVGGIGLRKQHYVTLLAEIPAEIDFFEIISENFMRTEGRPIEVVEALRTQRPFCMHGVSLSIGSTDPLDRDYLTLLKELRDRLQAFCVSDHLCWTSLGGHNSHDLLPLPYNEKVLDHVCRKVDEVQDFLGRPLVLENPSFYVGFESSTLSEWEFVSRLVARTGCGFLLDLNNIYVNSKNFGFDAQTVLEKYPLHAVHQIHLAGHSQQPGYLFDTHSSAVCTEVWDLYRSFLHLGGDAPVLVEWDDEIPELMTVVAELIKAREIWRQNASRNARTAPVYC